MKVLITGATGMVGRAVLLECLDHKDVSEIVCIGRNSIDMEHSKLKQIIHKDFSDFDSIKHELKDFEACFACMGVSVAGLKEEEYFRLTYTYTMALALPFYQLNPEATFIYVSGEGTDSSEKGRSMWARVKGKTENAILALGFKQVFMFRPGAIIPLKGIKSRTRLYQFFYDYFMWLLKFIKWLAPSQVVNTSQIGLAMINAVKKGYGNSIIRPKDIICLATGE